MGRSKSSYKSHSYSGPRSRRKQVRAQLKRFHGGDVSRADVWRKKPDLPNASSDVTPSKLKTYARKPQRTAVEAGLQDEPPIQKATPENAQEVTNNWPLTNPTLDIHQLPIEPAPSDNLCDLSGYRMEFLTGDEWISCQTDANKLVQQTRSNKVSLFGPDESWPEKTKPADTEEPATATTKAPSETNDFIDDEIILEDIQPSYEEKADEDRIDPLEEWEVKKQLCRCCLVEGTFDSLLSPAPGDDLTYHDMLMQTFSIQLSPVSSDVTAALRGVCGLCAARLRDAHAFRHQVIATEARFRDLCTRNCITVAGAAALEEEIKQETPDIDNYIGMDDADNSPDLPLKINETKASDGDEHNKKTEHSPTGKGNEETEQKAATAPTKPRNETKRRKNKYVYVQHRHLPASELVWTEGRYCTQCKKPCTQLSSMRSHLQRIKSTKRTNSQQMTNIKCTLCDNSFKTIIQLKNHKLKEHNIDDRYKCGACDRAFNLKYQLTKHLAGYHMMGERLQCSMCGFECNHRYSLNRHMDKHKKIKDFHCKYCKKSFLRKRTLALHEKIHTGDKQKQCTECGQAFVQKASLNYHMAKYHPEVKF